ncbi:MAG TPA: MotA/TolQ/ExbB proton channel family protein [Candidatus Obscuribacterales bacterium]
MGIINDLFGSVVALPLFITSVVAMLLIFERLWFWRHLAKRQQPLVRDVLDCYGQQPQAAIAKLKQHQDLPIARIFLAALTLPEATPEEFRLALESSAQGELPLLQRFSAAFNTIVGIAPLLGLLGTITGLIRALTSLEIGSGNSDRALEVIAGIGEALITTAVGLVIAITTLIFANFFQGRYRRQRAFMQVVGGQLELLYRRQYRQFLQSPRDRPRPLSPPSYP